MVDSWIPKTQHKGLVLKLILVFFLLHVYLYQKLCVERKVLGLSIWKNNSSEAMTILLPAFSFSSCLHIKKKKKCLRTIVPTSLMSLKTNILDFLYDASYRGIETRRPRRERKLPSSWKKGPRNTVSETMRISTWSTSPAYMSQSGAHQAPHPHL